MSSITFNIRVEIKNIEVDNFYYSFKYRVLVNDRVHTDWDDYESDHSWGNDKKGFKKKLEQGEAINLVMEQVNFEKL